jgi:oligoribonuclease (3'-5' exoribonuclease)
MADSQFKNVDKVVFELAGAIDGLIRVLSSNKQFEELEIDYLKNWLNKEQDPLLGTIIAQLVGLREVETPTRPEEE